MEEQVRVLRDRREGGPSGLDDPFVTPHVVDQADKAFVQDGNRCVEDIVGLGDDAMCHEMLRIRFSTV